MTPANPANRLPDSAYRGLAAEYVELMEPTTEAPPEYHLGAFLTVTGLGFAEAHLAEGGYRHHPTFFSLLVGPTGQARKTTVNKAATDFLSAVAPDIPTVHAEGSRQGLIEALIRSTKVLGGMPSAATLAAMADPDHPLGAGQGNAAIGTPTLVRAGEFTKTLRQAGRAATGDLTEFWLDLYDRGDKLENNTRRDPSVLYNPVAALLGDSTDDALADLFGEGNVSNGFLNRLSLWTGDHSGDPKPRPPAPNRAAYGRLVGNVRDLRDKTPTDLTVEWSPEGGDAFDDLYAATLYPRRGGANGAALAREESQVKRYALALALLRGSPTIDPEDIEQAWSIVEYLSHGALTLAGRVGGGGKAKALRYIEDAVDRMARRGHPIKASPGYVRREIADSKRGTVDAWGSTEDLLKILAEDKRVVEHAGHYYTIDTHPNNPANLPNLETLTTVEVGK